MSDWAVIQETVRFTPGDTISIISQQLPPFGMLERKRRMMQETCFEVHAAWAGTAREPVET